MTQDVTVLYSAEAIDTAIIEGLGHLAQPLPPHGRWAMEICPNRVFTPIRPQRQELVAQDLVDASPATIGAPDDLGDGTWERVGTQEWARAIRRDRPADDRVAAVRYWSARDRTGTGHRRGVNLAIFDTAPAMAVRVPGVGIGGTAALSAHSRGLFRRIRRLFGRHGVATGMISEVSCPKCSGPYGLPPP